MQRSEIRYDDERAKRHIVFSDLAISAAAAAELGWAAIQASAQIVSEANANTNAKAAGRSGKEQERSALSVTAEAAVRPEQGLYAMRGARLRLQSNGAAPGSSAFAADITGGGSYDTNTNAVIASLAIAALDLAIKAELNAQPGADARAPTRFDGKLGVSDFDLRALLKKFGKSVPVMRDPSMLSRARLALDLSGDSKRVVLRPSGQLDDSALAGEITVQNPFEHPVIRFVLLIDKLNADRYRPPSLKAPSMSTRDPFAGLSLEKLRELGLDMRGEIRVGTLILNGDRTRNFVAKLDWNP